MDRPLVLKGGTVFDGLGNPGRVADVVIEDGRITDVSSRSRARRFVDCRGLYVAPGFVDVHSHGDLVALMPAPQPYKLQQGVTTEVVGNCGFGFAPLDEEAARLAASLFGHLTGGVEVAPGSFGEFLDRLEAAGPTQNVAALVGHHALRLTVTREAAEAKPSAVERMRKLAAEAFEDGAIGLSTGLVYPPGSFADMNELRSLVSVATRYGGIYATHLRDEGKHVLAALDEAIAVAREVGARLQVSHCKVMGRANHGRSRALLDRLARARVEGIDVFGDQYPYRASGTALRALLPGSAFDGGLDAMRERLIDPDQRARLRRAAERAAAGDGLWPTSSRRPDHQPCRSGSRRAVACEPRRLGRPVRRALQARSCRSFRDDGPGLDIGARRAEDHEKSAGHDRLRQRAAGRAAAPAHVGMLSDGSRPLRT